MENMKFAKADLNGNDFMKLFLTFLNVYWFIFFFREHNTSFLSFHSKPAVSIRQMHSFSMKEICGDKMNGNYHEELKW